MHDIYTYTVPLFIKHLRALSNILEKAEGFVKEKGVSEQSLLEDRIAPDMFPLLRQVQIACDNAKNGAARLAGVTAPSHADSETSFGALRSRIEATVVFLTEARREQFAQAHERRIELPYFPGKYMTGFDYAREYLIPNFFFHVTAAYALLRKQGLSIGKADFMGGLPLKDK